MLGPTTWAVEKRGSSTVKSPASRITSMHRSRRVTNQPSRTGHPGDGFTLSKVGERAMRIRVELFEREGRAEGIPPLHRSHRFTSGIARHRSMALQDGPETLELGLVDVAVGEPGAQGVDRRITWR